MPTSTGDIVKDWSGAGLKVIESGHTGSNFSVNGEKKLFHKVGVTLRSTETILRAVSTASIWCTTPQSLAWLTACALSWVTKGSA